MKRIFGYFCRVYGNESTHLHLTDKAEMFYSGCDPLTIYERDEDVEDADGSIIDTEYRYTISGVVETIEWDRSRRWMTEDEVNALLEEVANNQLN